MKVIDLCLVGGGLGSCTEINFERDSEFNHESNARASLFVFESESSFRPILQHFGCISNLLDFSPNSFRATLGHFRSSSIMQ